MYAQLDDQPLLLHFDFEDEDDIALNEQDMTYDEIEPTAEYSTDAKIGTGAASFDGVAQPNTGEIGVTDYEEPPETPVEEFVMKIGYSNSLWPADEAEENQFPYFTGLMDDFRMYGTALSADDVAELFAITSVKGYSADLDFSVFPNPASQYIMIKSTRVRDLEIFNAVGQLVQSDKSVQDGSMISIANLEKGLYFVKSEDATQKLIVE